MASKEQEFWEEKLQELIDKTKKKRIRVLEIGPGDKPVLRRLKKEGREVELVLLDADISPEQKAAYEKEGFHVDEGNARELSEKGMGKFDIIVSNNVLSIQGLTTPLGREPLDAYARGDMDRLDELADDAVKGLREIHDHVFESLQPNGLAVHRGFDFNWNETPFESRKPYLVLEVGQNHITLKKPGQEVSQNERATDARNRSILARKRSRFPR